MRARTYKEEPGLVQPFKVSIFSKATYLFKGFFLALFLSFIAFFHHAIHLLILPFNWLLNHYWKMPHLPPYLSPTMRLQYNFLWHYRWFKKDSTRLKSLETKLQKKSLARSKKYGPGPTIPVSRVQPEDIDPRSWSNIFDGFPVVFEGLLKESWAVKHWSLDFFKNNFGSIEVNARKFGRKQDPYNSGSEMVTLSQAIHEIRNNGSLYPSASANLFAKYPKLLDDLSLETLEKKFHRNIFRVELFMGGAQNFSSFHSEPSGVLFCQVHGEKKWTFVSPHHSLWIYSEIGFGSDGRFFISPIVSDNDEENEEKYPLFKYVPKYTAHLKAGDVLYSPPWWWHEVQNLGESIGVPIRLLTMEDLMHLSNVLLFIRSPAFREIFIPAMKGTFFKSHEKDFFLSDRFSQNIYRGKS